MIFYAEFSIQKCVIVFHLGGNNSSGILKLKTKVKSLKSYHLQRGCWTKDWNSCLNLTISTSFIVFFYNICWKWPPFKLSDHLAISAGLLMRHLLFCTGICTLLTWLNCGRSPENYVSLKFGLHHFYFFVFLETPPLAWVQ